MRNYSVSCFVISIITPICVNNHKRRPMKKLLFIFVVIFLSAFQVNAMLPVCDDGDDPEEIELNQQQGGDENPTSLNLLSVRAFKTSQGIIVNLSNYTGNVAIVVTGTGGSILSAHNQIIDIGSIFINTTSLPSGSYTLLIYVNNTYVGYLTK